MSKRNKHDDASSKPRLGWISCAICSSTDNPVAPFCQPRWSSARTCDISCLKPIKQRPLPLPEERKLRKKPYNYTASTPNLADLVPGGSHSAPAAIWLQ